MHQKSQLARCIPVYPCIIACALTLGLTPRTTYSQPSKQADPAALEPLDAKPRIDRWSQDITFLGTEFPSKHPNPFFKLKKEAWEAKLDQIKKSIATTTDAQLVVQLRQLIASVGDGHSYLWIDQQSTIHTFRHYPLVCTWMSDGFFVAAISDDHADLIGQRVIRLGAMTIDDAAKRITAMRPYDNLSGMKNNVMADLREVESLVGLGIVGADELLSLTVQDKDQKETTVTLMPATPAPGQPKRPLPKLAVKPDPSQMGITRRVPRVAFGHELLKDSNTFYIWYDTCGDQKDKTVAQFIEETIKALDEELAHQPSTVDRVVVDFRRNGGGNSALFMPMIDALKRRDAINKPGKLFALIGCRTYSSAVMNAWQMKKATSCLLVGEPTGGTPNGYGEVRNFKLPNSKLSVQYSTKKWNLTGDDADAVYPDLPITPDGAAFFSTRDAVLETAVQHKPDSPR